MFELGLQSPEESFDAQQVQNGMYEIV